MRVLRRDHMKREINADHAATTCKRSITKITGFYDLSNMGFGNEKPNTNKMPCFCRGKYQIQRVDWIYLIYIGFLIKYRILYIWQNTQLSNKDDPCLKYSQKIASTVC